MDKSIAQHIETHDIQRRKQRALHLPCIYVLALLLALPVSYRPEGDNVMFHFWSFVLSVSILGVGSLISDLKETIKVE